MDRYGSSKLARACSAREGSCGLMTKCRLGLVYMLLVANLSLLNKSLAQSNWSPDAKGLQALRVGVDVQGALTASWVGDDPCVNGPGKSTWQGITCNIRSRVDVVLLDNLNLTGTIPENSLSLLNEVKTITVSFNQLSGGIPNLSNCTSLLQLFLQSNQLSGQIPNFLAKSRRLLKLDLSRNNLDGPIPDVSGDSALVYLNVSYNSLNGSIPPLSNSKLRALDISNNNLQGEIPASLRNFTAEVFSGNNLLCGSPLPTDCASVLNPSAPPNPIFIPEGNAPSPGPAEAAEAGGERKKQKLGTGAVIAIVVGDTLVLVMLTVVFLIYYWRKYSKDVDEKPGMKGAAGDTKSNSGFSQSSAQLSSLKDSEAEISKLIFFDESQQRFELEDLLRASAEMLGKGSFGTAYKAVLESGMIVAVKRLRDLRTETSRSDFESHMELLGKLKHPNLVPLRAYYYAKEEKLLVYDYMSNGNLFSMLHGNRGSGRTPLDWTSRLRIAREVAIGLAYLHQEFESQKMFHGNIKSSNILVSKNYEICISDVGLVALMNPAIAAHRMAGYRAPEYNHTKRITHKADVYSFGVLLLELLTGRQPAQTHESQGNGVDLPKWVHSVVREEWTAEVFDLELKSFRHGEEEMVTLLQIAMACVTPNPEQRPRMPQVVKLIEEIRAADICETSESFDSQTQTADLTGHDSPFHL
ncbi:hypothetical protein MPTK1_7g12510 [Marchantia polymorpha subsp. ruderalis]|uniref:Protein kinase domain-containing protein n=2 Tax=Marchantia polymorpha TaxID=3197 RepID=A0AAF6BYT2_MARPO|nr:hypothetical protein MARPO_0003s0259 [Marchantia polymorpha]BBN17166.1 hypothetical protein Mp_7g12510 [Marchantia polymorpha subsp. ruderalis]|eukprot:PTQ49400.1 hypothetical protein MARPO_0003s0259 [Marchantia polymorpha]